MSALMTLSPRLCAGATAVSGRSDLDMAGGLFMDAPRLSRGKLRQLRAAALAARDDGQFSSVRLGLTEREIGSKHSDWSEQEIRSAAQMKLLKRAGITW